MCKCDKAIILLILLKSAPKMVCVQIPFLFKTFFYQTHKFFEDKTQFWFWANGGGGIEGLKKRQKWNVEKTEKPFWYRLTSTLLKTERISFTKISPSHWYHLIGRRSIAVTTNLLSSPPTILSNKFWVERWKSPFSSWTSWMMTTVWPDCNIIFHHLTIYINENLPKSIQNLPK